MRYLVAPDATVSGIPAVCWTFDYEELDTSMALKIKYGTKHRIERAVEFTEEEFLREGTSGTKSGRLWYVFRIEGHPSVRVVHVPQRAVRFEP